MLDVPRHLLEVHWHPWWPSHHLETLEDCAKFIGHMHRWRQARPYWDHAADLVLKAAKTGQRVDVDAAAEQMERALRCDGWFCGIWSPQMAPGPPVGSITPVSFRRK
jgi:hypothetical protein